MSPGTQEDSQEDGASPEAGQRYGRYSLLERIAIGGMAEIYRAKTHGAAGFEKEVVIKRILPQLSADSDFVRMFIDEARLVARLQHANIVQIFDFDRASLAADDEPTYYIAMEYVEGKDLRSLFREGARFRRPMGAGEAIYVAVEALRGLHYAHTRVENGRDLGIVHRDVSPHNILVSFAGEVKLSDFGIAKAVARASVTTNGMVRGKLTYMSPEQVTGQALDGRSDLYSMGIILWELLAQRRLYQGLEEPDIVDRVRDGKVPKLRSVAPQVPVELERIVARMTAREPASRFESAAEAAKALAASPLYGLSSMALGQYVREVFPEGRKRATLIPANKTLPDGEAKGLPNMSNSKDPPKKTQIVPPGGMASGGPPPPAPAPSPTGSGQAPSNQATMMLDRAPAVVAPVAPQKPVVPTLMQQMPSGRLPLVQRPRKSPLRWVFGPLLAGLVGVGSAFGARIVMPLKPPAPKAKLMGRIRLGSKPPGASVMVNGKPHPAFTPTVLEAEVGTIAKVSFALDGYEPKEAEILVAEGDNPFTLLMTPKKVETPEPVEAPPVVEEKRPVEKPSKHEHKHATKAVMKEPEGKSLLSIQVRPWAIVYVDGQQLRQTPVYRYVIASGKHTITLVNEPKGRRESYPVSLAPGESKEIKLDWDK